MHETRTGGVLCGRASSYTWRSPCSLPSWSPSSPAWRPGASEEHARERERPTTVKEARAPESDEDLRLFLDDATIGLRWVDPDGRILWANRAELALARGRDPH